jgi:hypothetical protein
MRPGLECGVTASFLESGKALAAASHTGALVAGVAILIVHSLVPRVVFASSLLCWVAGCWFGLRVAIDASLFRALAAEAEDAWPRFDALLVEWGLRRTTRERSVAERIRGALALWRKQGMLLALQLVTLVSGMFLAAAGL